MRNKNSNWLEAERRAAVAAAKAMQHLSAGDLAELRRMPEAGGGPAFWRLAAQNPDTIGRGGAWVSILRALATLAARGDPAQRPELHHPKRRLGAVLCDGGDPGWSGGTPVFSEARLRHLIAAPRDQRARLMERAARMIRARMAPGSGVNAADVAAALRLRDPGKLLARPYYLRLDSGQSKDRKPAD